MKKILLAAALGVSAFLSGSSTLFAQTPAPSGLLPPGERKAYHACLRARWVDEYCRLRALGAFWDYGAVFDACLIANHVSPGNVLVRGPGANDPCWYLLQGGPR